MVLIFHLLIYFETQLVNYVIFSISRVEETEAEKIERLKKWEQFLEGDSSEKKGENVINQNQNKDKIKCSEETKS